MTDALRNFGDVHYAKHDSRCCARRRLPPHGNRPEHILLPFLFDSNIADMSLGESEVALLRSVVGDHGQLIFAMRCGSWAYNMQTPTSDIVRSLS